MPEPEANPFQELHDKLAAFAADMAQEGIHLGLGVGWAPAMCVSCGELWPCAASQARRPTQKRKSRR